MNKELQVVEQLSPGASIEDYTNGVFRIPILNKKEELKFLEDFIHNDNVDSARKAYFIALAFCYLCSSWLPWLWFTIGRYYSRRQYWFNEGFAKV